jgi:hypothetical protein
MICLHTRFHILTVSCSLIIAFSPQPKEMFTQPLFSLHKKAWLNKSCMFKVYGVLLFQDLKVSGDIVTPNLQICATVMLLLTVGN